ncbi:leucine-rich repeat domain-containing protein [Dysgonomonas sp. 511]|uniref:leucine-rich repeat domain-containing protein n=1 Tax=Dysgonomonas sp. 511 TaxID=2302930 RepID=UPI0013D225F4|nr:leucine-rich repeat domain-containing protein [Dysgonomonas sp. 511]NDV79594.1 leucine-rich repeat domain-containing protein [Dysgonomonas sp. 511]
MKLKLTFILTFILLSVASMQAQTTIGSDSKPEEGALLQLQHTSNTKGMMLPRVKILKITATGGDLRETVDDANAIPGDPWDLDAHKGLMVYCMEPPLCYSQGVYVWMGDRWEGVPSSKYGGTNGSYASDKAALDQFIADNSELGSIWPNWTTNNNSTPSLYEVKRGTKPVSQAEWEADGKEGERRSRTRYSTYAGSGSMPELITIEEKWTVICGEWRLTGLRVSHKLITKTSQIKNMYALQVLALPANPLTDLDVSTLKDLESINLYGCYKLKTLTLGNLPKLETIRISGNGEKDYGFDPVDIDHAGDPAQVVYQGTYQNILAKGELSTIDVSGCPALATLTLINQPIAHLDLSKNTKLEILNMNYTSSTSVGPFTGFVFPLSNNPELKDLDLSRQSLSSIDVSGCPKLSSLICRDNASLTSITVSTIPSIKTFTASYCNLSTLSLGAQAQTITDLNINYNKLTQIVINNLCKEFKDAGQCDRWNGFTTNNIIKQNGSTLSKPTCTP